MAEFQSDFTWWLNALAGNRGDSAHDKPEHGYYRGKRKDGSSVPVAYWGDSHTGELRCKVNGKDLDELRALEMWPFVSMRPISYEVYQEALATGQWPDQHEAVTQSNRAPPDNSFEALRDRVEDLAREAAKIAEVKTQEEADQAADLANKLGELEGAADAQRASEKKPHDEAAKAVQVKWRPVVEAAEAAKRRLKAIIGPFLAAKDAAERKAREEAARAGAPPPEQQRKAGPVAGTRGRAVALRSVKHVEIVDRAAVLAYFADGKAMTEFLQTLAEKAVRAGIDVPGTKVTEQKVAA